ncbi:MAG: diaminopimelate epimerase [Mycobacteriales bacterium]|nr:diaminopimelate epimerase [Mycobacteriales bacterium]
MIPGTGIRYLKGHGTENDFVLLPDLDGTLKLDADLVRRLCDRRAGIGADGVLRVVPAELDPDGSVFAGTGEGEARWFMDYRNADGSVAEMCGNGVRVYARFLVDAGLARPGEMNLATRGGVKRVDVSPGGGPVTVDMGRAVVGEPVEIDGLLATAVDMGNPHAVVHVADVDALGVLDPSRKDLNVEYVADLAEHHIAMRVHERGVGETRSCGTGACAAVVATALRTCTPRGTAHRVDVPGGTLDVTWQEDGHVTLRGPAVIVAEGELRRDWLDQR